MSKTYHRKPPLDKCTETSPPFQMTTVDAGIILTTFKYLSRNIRDREAAMVALNHFHLDEIIREILRVFPDHHGIHKLGRRVLWGLSYPQEKIILTV